MSQPRHLIAYDPTSAKLLTIPNHSETIGQLELYAGGYVVDESNLRAGDVIDLGIEQSTVRPSLDFETYSAVAFDIDPVTKKVKGAGSQGKGGLKVSGTPAYAEHPTTEILCLYYDLKDGRGLRRWLPGMPDPVDLLDYIRNGGEAEAFNVTFEFWIWNIIGVRRHGWPVLPLSQCHCVMARSRRYSLPGALGNVAKVLGTADKDAAGKRLLQKLSRPHTPTKNRPDIRWTPATAWEDFNQLYDYCGQDVVAEDAVAARVPDLTPYEDAVWRADQEINARGVQVDMETLSAATEILRQATEKYTAELVELTGGVVTSVNAVKVMREWIIERGIWLDSLDADNVEEALARPGLPPDVRRVMEIRSRLGAANVKKLRTLALQVSSDGRLRDQYTYCGADRTGRWSAGGVQLQNLTSKGPSNVVKCDQCGKHYVPGNGLLGGCPSCSGESWTACGDWLIDQMRDAIEDVRTRRLDVVEAVWGDAIAVLSGILRALFIAKPGHDLICCDFSAIEAVAAACVSRCQWRIEVFSTHGKIYEQSAANATGIPFEDFLAYKQEHGTHHPLRKKIGKVRELAGGYAGWIGAWKNFGAGDYYDDDDAIKEDVLKWRDESPEIVEMWGGQYRWCGPGKWDYRPELFGLEGCAILAIQNPGKCYSHTDITYGVWNDILYCRLPSGRFLHYHRPRLVPVEDKLRRGPAVSITFEAYNTNAQKGPIGWHRWDTFGGRLFENVVQGLSADIQAEALLRLKAAGYPVVMHTHDEATAEVPHGWGSVEEMAAIMSERPTWASWWPIKAAGWRDDRYQKD